MSKKTAAQLDAEIKAATAVIKLDDLSLYKATVSKSKNGKIYALGRLTKLDGHPKEQGGYAVFFFRVNYNGQIYGGLEKRWIVEDSSLTYSDAVALINKRLGRKEFSA